MHDPDRREINRAAQRAGGAARAAHRRAAKQYAAMGEAIRPEDLPAMLRGAFIDVWEGRLEPSQAQALAALAKASVSITSSIELEERMAALEREAFRDRIPYAPPSNIRKIGS